MEKYIEIAHKDEIPEGKAKRIEVGERYIAVFNVGGEYYAIDDTCSHEQASLSQGELEGYIIECPLHGSRFDIRTGQVKSLPAVLPVACYKLMVDGDDILIPEEWE